jgi:Mn2+/Fe2+ NRAMP family transporter
LKQARAFYTLILLSTGVGVGLDFAGINPVKAFYWTAVINGLLAPFLLVAILVIASDKKLMQGQTSSRLGWTVVAITTVAMWGSLIITLAMNYGSTVHFSTSFSTTSFYAETRSSRTVFRLQSVKSASVCNLSSQPN